ncbi:hypothetical protein [Dyella terrae]|uniref:hypothetical protein n=1 Tax=Dyella terrae TaxID=522259 RepID=UPI001EFC51CA|nr:hypothetical protein [Dyella terrae]ULU23190.1 hypothetical protein DYST_00081 [Dyella terrae]
MQKLSLADACPSMDYEIHLTDGEPYRSNRSLIVSFSGRYRDGSAGDPDAAFMKGIIGVASGIWWHKSLVIDVSKLTYEWGDMIEVALDPPGSRPIAIVVGPGCAGALATLWFGLDSERQATEQAGVFDHLDAALAYLRQDRA